MSIVINGKGVYKYGKLPYNWSCIILIGRHYEAQKIKKKN